MLDNHLVCPSLGKTISPAPSILQFPVILSVRLRPPEISSVHFSMSIAILVQVMVSHNLSQFTIFWAFGERRLYAYTGYFWSQASISPCLPMSSFQSYCLFLPVSNASILLHLLCNLYNCFPFSLAVS